MSAERPSPPATRPPWWPDDEVWPPAERWRGRGRRADLRHRRGGPGRHGPPTAAKAGCGFVLILLLAAVGFVALVSLLVSRATPLDGGLAEGATLGVWILLVGLVLLVLLFSGIVLGRVARSVDRLSTGVARLEAGDFEARVPEPRWSMGPLRSLVAAFNTMAERLEHDEETRRTLLADVSHELRNPLAVIQGELEAFQDGVHEPDPERIATLLGEVEVLSRLVDDLRTVTLAEAGTLALHPEPTDLGVLIEEVAASYAGIAGAAGVELSTEADPNLPLLEVDPIRMREVLMNLVANAVRHAGTRGRVTITAAPDDGTVRLEVTDSGPGIDPELLPRLFERFAKDPASPGFGLGLAIARGLVEAHGGSITAASEPGRETRMTVRLPNGGTPD